MTKQEFINLLVSSKFASQYEAEQHTYACGTNEWCYLNPLTKTHANSNENGTISYYTFEPKTQSHQKKIACLTSS